MLVIRVSPKDGTYRELDVPNWNAEVEQEWRNGRPLSDIPGLTEVERVYIESGELVETPVETPVETVVEPKRKAKVEPVVEQSEGEANG